MAVIKGMNRDSTSKVVIIICSATDLVKVMTNLIRWDNNYVVASNNKALSNQFIL